MFKFLPPLITASITTLAELNHISDEELIKKFNAHGIYVTKQQTVQEISTQY